MIYAKYISLFILASLGSIFTIAKPAKIVYPESTGVVCVESWLCVDDTSREAEARSLYESAFHGVEAKLSKFMSRPKVVFCSKLECFSSFGFDKAAATSIGSFGIVVAPRGWTQYYVEHELIHQWQSENYGFFSMMLASEWLKEGMAYSVSDDPREVLNEPFQTFRSQYESKFGKQRGSELMAMLDEEF